MVMQLTVCLQGANQDLTPTWHTWVSCMASLLHGVTLQAFQSGEK